MNKQRLILRTPSIALAAGIALLAAGGKGEDARVARKDIPQAALDAARFLSDGGALEDCVRAEEDGLKTLQLRMRKGDRRIEVQTLPSGELFASEERVPESAVPEAVRRRVARLFGKGRALAYERAVAVLYEVAHKDSAGKETTYLVSPAGKAYREVSDGGPAR